MVKCYDKSKMARQGLKDIYKFETGYHHEHETTTFYYDLTGIMIDEMESAVKNAETYAETINEKERN